MDTQLPADIEKLCHDLDPEKEPFTGKRIYAAAQLAHVSISNLQVVVALLNAIESDPSQMVRDKAWESIQATVHQRIIIQNHDLKTRYDYAQKAFNDTQKPIASPVSEPVVHQDNIIYCSKCGHPNPTYLTICQKCKTNLFAPVGKLDQFPQERPGCITAYVILMGIGMVFILIALITIAFRPAVLATVDVSAFDFLYIIPILIVSVITAIGLWQLKNWARILVIASQGISIIGEVLTLMSGEYSLTCTGLTGIVISGFIIYWFWANGKYFH
jgi:hypothetical protein